MQNEENSEDQQSCRDCGYAEKKLSSDGYMTDTRSEKFSLKSFSLNNRKRFVFKYPTGGYTHAVKFGDTDSWMDLKLGSDQENKGQQNGVSTFQRIQIQGELQSLIQNHDIVTDSEMALQEYVDHRKYLSFFLAGIFIYEIVIQIYFYENKDHIVSEIAQICRDLTKEKIRSLLEIRNVIDVFINLLMYISGFQALRTNKVTYWNSYSWLLMASIFSRLVISYFHLLNFMMFMLKTLLYFYSRLVLSLLYSVLLIHTIPPANPNPNYNNQGNANQNNGNANGDVNFTIDTIPVNPNSHIGIMYQ